MESDGVGVTSSIDLTSQLSDATATFRLATSKADEDMQLQGPLQVHPIEGQVPGLENVLLCSELAGVAVDVQQGQGQLTDDSSATYVDVKIKDDQIIRLKVPFNIDPVAYAAEYLQQAIVSEELN